MPHTDVEKYRAYQAEYRAKNRDRLRKYRQDRYQANREKIGAQTKAYRLANHEKVKAYYRKRHRAAQVASPWRLLFFSAKNRARVKKMAFTITLDWCKARWTGKCELTGLTFLLDQRGAGPKFWSPSIDRIDNTQGYEPHNCRFILQCVNQLKTTATDAELREIVRVLYEAMFTNSPLKSKA